MLLCNQESEELSFTVFLSNNFAKWIGTYSCFINFNSVKFVFLFFDDTRVIGQVSDFLLQITINSINFHELYNILANCYYFNSLIDRYRVYE